MKTRELEQKIRELEKELKKYKSECNTRFRKRFNYYRGRYVITDSNGPYLNPKITELGKKELQKYGLYYEETKEIGDRWEYHPRCCSPDHTGCAICGRSEYGMQVIDSGLNRFLFCSRHSDFFSLIFKILKDKK